MSSKLEHNKSLIMVVCYIGKLPWYFDYFIHSCAFNPSVDFLIFTDDNYKKEVPQNVIMKHINLNIFNKIASEKLGFTVNVKSGYKLCDFKPTYGLLFEEVLKKYDFWAYGDIDVIYGNIRKFINNNVLDKYEIISVRHDHLTGYFQLLRNNEKMNHFFRKSKDYQKVLQSDEHFCFDETNFAFEAFRSELKYSEINTEIESMMHIVKKEQELNNLKAYFDFHVIEGIPGKLKWKNGELFYKNRYEVLLYHLILFKKDKPISLFKNIPNQFLISPTRIY